MMYKAIALALSLILFLGCTSASVKTGAAGGEKDGNPAETADGNASGNETNASGNATPPPVKGSDGYIVDVGGSIPVRSN